MSNSGSSGRRSPVSRRKSQPGKIIILSSPSGGGKTSIARGLLKRKSRAGWRFSVSVTTRPRRPGERDGREYHFRTHAEFNALRANDLFAESCRVHSHQYGTLRSELESTVKRGQVILLDIDVKGAKKIQKAYPQAVSIFIIPPSKRELRRRLQARGTETREQLRIRRERSFIEMARYREFDYTVVNDELRRAIDDVENIIEASHTLTRRLDREQIERIIG